MVSIYAQFGKETYFFSGCSSKVTIEELEKRGYRISESYDCECEYVVIMIKR